MAQSSALNITILGVGAMGTLFGSYLSASAQVTLVGSWQAQIETLQTHPLTIIQPDDRTEQKWVKITSQIDQAPPADIILILVKSYRTAQAAQLAARLLRPEGLVISLQNGLGNLDSLTSVMGSKRVNQGVTTHGATLLAPGRLHHTGYGLTSLGISPENRVWTQRVVDLFNNAGLETRSSENIAGLVWGKLAINAGINPLTALLEVPNGTLASDEALRPIMIAAATEVASVAQAQGIVLPFANIAEQAVQVSLATARNRSSMLQDISRAAPTEIEAICGAVTQIGQRLNIPTPINNLLFQLVKEKEVGSLYLSAEQLKHFIVQRYRELLG